MDPDEIKIIVYGARNLRGGKKAKFKFSVIFGLEDSKYRTAVVHEPSGNPDWNEESTIKVSDSTGTLTLVVTDKDDVMGQVSVAVQSLPLEQSRREFKSILQEHRKCPLPQGELIYECFVTKYRVTPLNDEAKVPLVALRKSSTLKMLKNSFKSKASPKVVRRSRSKTEFADISGKVQSQEKQSNFLEVPNGGLSRRNSQSLQDISGRSKSLKYTSDRYSPEMRIRANSNPFNSENKRPTFMIEEDKPIGLSEECDSHVALPSVSTTASVSTALDQLQESPVSVGHISTPVTIETPPQKLPNQPKKENKRLLTRLTGYETRREKKRERVDSTHDLQAEATDTPSPMHKVKKDALIDKIKSLEVENRALKEQTKEMEDYIDKIVTKAMKRCPDILHS